MSLRVATDVGGTFTDIVKLWSYEDGTQKIETGKANTTPSHYEDAAVDLVSTVGNESIDYLVHGSTVTINSLLERKGVKTALITTKGFRDVLEIARGNRAAMFHLASMKAPPFVPRYLRKTVPGKISYKGVELKPPCLEKLDKIIELFRSEDIKAIAVCLINSYANPIHEVIVEEEIRKRWPEVHVICSHQITREWREYERTNTTVLSAYVQPIVEGYLDSLDQKLDGKNIHRKNLYVMQSNCGVDVVQRVRKNPISTVESGPASGILAAAELGKLIGETNVIALDIGGTTAKCSLISNGQIRLNSDYFIEKSDTSVGYPILAPVVDIVEIGTGGGSIAWRDEFQKLHVGPKSAGSVPGPVAYGRGGEKPTTTDANLLLGYINPKHIQGKVSLEAVQSSFQQLATEGQTVQEIAHSTVRMANHNMVKALKLVSVNRGYDPRDFTLVAFGGGGSLHACALASELGIGKVLIPNNSSVFSAWGMLLCDIRRDFVQNFTIPLASEDNVRTLGERVEALKVHSLKQFGEEGIRLERVTLQCFAQIRYQNQAHNLEIQLPELGGDCIDKITELFVEEYKREYKYSLSLPLELVGIHLTSFASVDKINPVVAKTTGITRNEILKGQRDVCFLETIFSPTDIYDLSKIEPGMYFQGPCIIEDAHSSIVVFPGMTATVDNYSNVHVTIPVGVTHPGEEKDDPITREIITSTLTTISEEMFLNIKRTAMSTIIYEVLDMGTGITDAKGNLAIVAKFGGKIRPGDIYALNDPYQGGVTHLNDVILAAPVFFENQIVAWNANIAHWTDIGGLAPGGISNEATEITQEGLRLPPIRIFKNNKPIDSAFEILKSNSRLPEFLIGDMWAGISAVQTGESRILELLNKYGMPLFQKALVDIEMFGETAALSGLQKIKPCKFTCSEEQDDGTVFKITIEISPIACEVDLSEMPPQLSNSMNSTKEASEIAAQVIFKAVTTPTLPGNCGNFNPLKVTTKQGTLCDPKFPAAMGMYYEPVMRINDLIGRGFVENVDFELPVGGYSSVCGTIIGGIHPDTGTLHTLLDPQLGGWGATPSNDGNCAQFTALHGATYNCPVEINEARNGVFINCLKFNKDKVGAGAHRGGKGICIEYVIRSKDAWLTAYFTRSKIPPWGAKGGKEGSPNYLEVIPVDGGPVQRLCNVSGMKLAVGDIVRVVTGNGAGYGDPKERPKHLVLQDVRDGIVSVEEAKGVYGYEF